MDFEVFLIVIVSIGAGLFVTIAGMRFEERKLRLKAGEGDAQIKGVIDEMHGEIVRLKGRVQVLERLVTDDDRKLSVEIEQLRPRV